jgi:FixJ family two-component response regulator
MWDKLTAREKQIAELLLQGCDNLEISKELGRASNIFGSMENEEDSAKDQSSGQSVASPEVFQLN